MITSSASIGSIEMICSRVGSWSRTARILPSWLSSSRITAFASEWSSTYWHSSAEFVWYTGTVAPSAEDRRSRSRSTPAECGRGSRPCRRGSMPIACEAERDLLDDRAQLLVGDVDPLVAELVAHAPAGSACFLAASAIRSASVLDPVAAALGVAASEPPSLPPLSVLGERL